MGLFSWLFGKKKKEEAIKGYFDLYDDKKSVSDDGQAQYFKDNASDNAKPAQNSTAKPKDTTKASAKRPAQSSAKPADGTANSAERPKKVSGAAKSAVEKPRENAEKKEKGEKTKTSAARLDGAESSEASEKSSRKSKIAKGEAVAETPAKEEKTAVTEVSAKAEKTADAASKSKDNQADNSTRKTGRYEIKKTRDGRFVFNLYAPNSVIVATSQIYSSSQSAINGIESIIANAAKAPVEDQTLKSFAVKTYPKWELYSDNAGQYRFRLNAPNGNCIVHSQGYTTKASCKNGIESIIRCSVNPEIDKSYLKKQ